ncbi:hypothetical protein GOY14_02130 [Wolbachia endosymbiont of Dipetalonema caudispina]|uniref:hypothetical protein n=1 Tax=Wolbachia endosymbiont of Dipetalonema caudispina TaxID=1812112 RepID=UPI001589CB6F|nr:hypothetical protein [Wolbachia endosymbiont of Dipetalonema caudispina]QKX01127.1 hypothetical protein GOY14_02130 [Wolbachia endosymbiont of Dipetalonema caudispina]
MSEVRNNSIIIYCCGCEDDDEYFGHPLIYLYKEKGKKTFCPYCNKIMNKALKSKKSKLVNKHILSTNKKR